MKLIDVHCHLDLKKFEKDLEEALERAKKAGVLTLIQNTLRPKSTRRSLEIAEKSDIVKLALGIYPVDALKLSGEEIDSEIDFIRKQIKENPKVIAIGEVGLDYHWVKDKKEQQREKKILEKFISLAEQTKKPMIIHSREAQKDTFEMIQSSNAKVVFHCFDGNLKVAKKAADMGHYFSIPTSIVYLEHFQQLAEYIDIKQLFAETDSPFMSPFRGKRNEPAFVLEAYKKIAEIKKKSTEEIAEAISDNYNRVFR